MRRLWRFPCARNGGRVLRGLWRFPLATLIAKTAHIGGFYGDLLALDIIDSLELDLRVL